MVIATGITEDGGREVLGVMVGDSETEVFYAHSQRARLAELRLTATEERLACDLSRGLVEQSVADLAALSREHALRERLTELFMAALAA